MYIFSQILIISELTNNMNKTKFIDESNKNAFKTILIMAVMTGIITAFGFLIATATNNPNFITYALFIAIGQNFISYFFGASIALKMSGAVPADENKYADLHKIVQDLADKNEIKKPTVYIINDPAPNAFATGRGGNSSSVAATTGLLAMLDRGELEGVMAHELTHVKNRDMLVMTIVVTMSAVLSSMANMAAFASMSRDRENNNGVLMMTVAVLGNILLPLVSLFIQSAISRRREFMADAGGAILTEHPEALASALQKIGGFKQPMQNAKPATAHLYISCPFGGKGAQTFYQKLFMTHPPIEERVKALLA
jgi:heat shock protein HtpX